MKNSTYFQATNTVKSRFKHLAVNPKQSNLFYLKTTDANFALLNSKQKARLVKDVNRLFGNDFHMMEYFAKKHNLSVKDSVQGVELIIP